MTREQIHIWLDSELIEKLDKKRDGLTRTIVIQKLIEGWVKGDSELNLPR
jgi:hypothetical protein